MKAPRLFFALLVSLICLFAIPQLGSAFLGLAQTPTVLYPTGTPSMDRAALQSAASAGGPYLLKAFPTSWNLGTTSLPLASAAAVTFSGEPGTTITGTEGPILWLNGPGTFTLEGLTLNSSKSVVGVQNVAGLTIKNCTINAALGWSGTGGWFGLFFYPSIFSANPVPVEIVGNKFGGDNSRNDNRGLGISFSNTYKHHYNATIKNNEFRVYTMMQLYNPNGTYVIEDNWGYFEQSNMTGVGIGIYHFNPALLVPGFGNNISVKRNHIEIRSTNGAYWPVGIGRQTEFPQNYFLNIEIADNDFVGPMNPVSFNHRFKYAGIMFHGGCNATVSGNRFSGLMSNGILLGTMSLATSYFPCKNNKFFSNDFSNAIVVEWNNWRGKVIVDDDLPGYPIAPAGQDNVFVNNIFGAGDITIGGVRYVCSYGIYSKGSRSTFVGNTLLGPYAVADVYLRAEAGDNYFGADGRNGLPGNIFGPLTPGGIAGIVDNGQNNSFVNNDYTQSGILGLRSSENVCVWLTSSTSGALVFESGSFPRGTGGASEQVVDQGMANRVVGHRANELAAQEGVRPGIGQRLKAIKQQLQEQEQLYLLSEPIDTTSKNQ